MPWKTNCAAATDNLSDDLRHCVGTGLSLSQRSLSGTKPIMAAASQAGALVEAVLSESVLELRTRDAKAAGGGRDIATMGGEGLTVEIELSRFDV